MTTNTLMTDAPIPDGTGSQTAAPTGDAQAAPAGDANTQQTSDQQTADTAKTGDAAQVEGEADAPKGAPEAYQFKGPEGSKFDTKVIEEFASVAKELDLPQDAAQKILDKVGPVIAARQAEARDAAVQQWADDAKTDKEFGGEKLNENLAVAKKALDAFGSPELRTLLNESGLGNHPELIRMMVRAGKAISEDTMVTGGQGGSTDRAAASVLYPNQK
jgi:hypothetical protein